MSRREDSRAGLVMLIGSPRSGTTWLQSMLGSHPAIATPQETDLFRVFLEPLAAAWDKQNSGTIDAEQTRRRKGLPLTITEHEFLEAAGTLLDTTLAAIQKLKPGASTIIEKSPAHSMCTETIVRFVPDARFLHIIRDGRDVADSLVAANSDGWGSKWAPNSVARAGRIWEQHLLSARRAQQHSRDRYFELRYEDLLGPDAADLLIATFAFCGVAIDHSESCALLDANEFSRMRTSGQVSNSILTGGESGDGELARAEPPGFFRRGGSGGWRTSWSMSDRRAFCSVAGALLADLGYERDDSWVGSRAKPSLSVRAANRAANSAAAVLRRFANTIEELPRPRQKRPKS